MTESQAAAIIALFESFVDAKLWLYNERRQGLPYAQAATIVDKRREDLKKLLEQLNDKS